MHDVETKTSDTAIKLGRVPCSGVAAVSTPSLHRRSYDGKLR